MIEKLKNLSEEKKYAYDWIALLEFMIENKYISLQAKEDLNSFADNILDKDKNNFADKIVQALEKKIITY